MVVLRTLGRGRVATTGARPGVAASGWVVVVGAAAMLGALSVREPLVGFIFLGAVVVTFLVFRPGAAGVLSVATLPFSGPALPGLGRAVGAPDMLLVVALLGWGVRDLVRPTPSDAVAGVRPLAIGLIAYAGVAAATLVMHPSGVGVVAGVHRAEIVVGGLLLGARLVRERLVRPALGGYLLAAGVLALVAVSSSGAESFLGVQKNPAGGFLAAGLVMAVVLRPYRWWWAAAPVLGVGLVATQSRGALLGLAAGALLTLVVVRYRERVRVLGSLLVAAIVFYAAYENLPDAAKTRLQTLSGASDFAIRYREEFQADAIDVYHAHPWLGVGIGNYVGGVRQPGITDPHQVVYFQLAEGGVLLLVAMGLLILVSLLVAFVHVGGTRFAVAAVAVQVSTLVHSFGDIYWVRGTPVPAFILVGATLATAAYQKRRDQRGREWAVRGRDGLPLVADQEPDDLGPDDADAPHPLTRAS